MSTVQRSVVDVAGRKVLGVSEHTDVAAVLADASIHHGSTVLHDVNVPLSQSQVIDHVIVTGREVWVAESLLWADAPPRFRARLDRPDIEHAAMQIKARLLNHGFDVPVRPLSIVVGVGSTRIKSSKLACDHTVTSLDELASWCDRSVASPSYPGIVDDLVPLLRTPLQPTGLIAAGVL